MRGGPIRFVALVVGGWTALRLVSPPLGSMPLPTLPFSPFQPRAPMLASLNLPSPHPPDRTVPVATATPHRTEARPLAMPIAAGGWSPALVDRMIDTQLAFARVPGPPRALAAFAPGAGFSADEAGVPPLAIPGPPAATSSTRRWSGAAWMLWRDGDDLLPRTRPRLGGSQAGVRLDYRLAPRSALAPTLYARATGALYAPTAMQLAGGIAMRPVASLPVTVAVERRQALSSGARSDFALLAAGGVDHVPLGGGRLRLDGYGQAGAIGFGPPDGFADGRLTVDRVLSPRGGSGKGEIALGAGLWGNAQPDVARLDAGPAASARLHLGNATFRISAEWRESIAGDARPRSGGALTLAADF